MMSILFTSCFVWIIFNSREVKGGDCNDELGMQNKGISDERISASSSLSPNHVPAFARLYEREGAWCSAPDDNSSYVQIILDKKKSITKITTQGSLKDPQRWATKYQIKYQKEGKWFTYQNEDGSMTFEGNENVRRPEDNYLHPPIRTYSIRIYPMEPQSDGMTPNVTLKDVVCLRLELYGCSAPINGGWGEWGPWSECSMTCGTGVRSRERKCDSPRPDHGGVPCNVTEKVDRGHCRKQKCPVIDGGWSKWGRWSECSLTCGLGMMSRERKCDSPKPRNGGTPCDEAEREQKRFCRKRKCGEMRDDDEGYSGSGHGWETYSDDGNGHGDRSGHEDSSGSSPDGWHTYNYNKKIVWRDNDDEDY